MGEKLRYTVSGTIQDQETFNALAKRLVQEVESEEPGCLDYEWFANGNQFFIHEIYENSNAFLEHMRIRTERGELDELMACATIDEVLVLTKPSSEAKKIADDFNARYLHGIGGVVR